MEYPEFTFPCPHGIIGKIKTQKGCLSWVIPKAGPARSAGNFGKKQHIIDVAAGREKADLVLKNATFVNVFSGELETSDIAVADGLIVGLGSYDGKAEVDMTGKIVCPGFIDVVSQQYI